VSTAAEDQPSQRQQHHSTTTKPKPSRHQSSALSLLYCSFGALRDPPFGQVRCACTFVKFATDARGAVASLRRARQKFKWRKATKMQSMRPMLPTAFSRSITITQPQKAPSRVHEGAQELQSPRFLHHGLSTQSSRGRAWASTNISPIKPVTATI
jgi:hypothetical protein